MRHACSVSVRSTLQCDFADRITLGATNRHADSRSVSQPVGQSASKSASQSVMWSVGQSYAGLVDCALQLCVCVCVCARCDVKMADACRLLPIAATALERVSQQTCRGAPPAGPLVMHSKGPGGGVRGKRAGRGGAHICNFNEVAAEGVGVRDGPEALGCSAAPKEGAHLGEHVEGALGLRQVPPCRTT